MKAYQADIAKFEATDTQVFGISVDSVPANREFAKQNGITFPLLSDFAKRSVVKDYGIFSEEGGYGNRATFVIDKERHHSAHRGRQRSDRSDQRHGRLQHPDAQESHAIAATDDSVSRRQRLRGAG